MSFSDDFAAAIPEFDAALQIDPQFRYLNPWRIVALKRLGKSDDLKTQYGDSLKKDLKQRDWVDHLVAYLLGAETEANLLAATNDPKDPLKNDELCEGEYFIGVTKASGRQHGRSPGGLSAGRRDKIPAALGLPRSPIRSEEGQFAPSTPASVAVPTTTGQDRAQHRQIGHLRADPLATLRGKLPSVVEVDAARHDGSDGHSRTGGLRSRGRGRRNRARHAEQSDGCRRAR